MNAGIRGVLRWQAVAGVAGSVIIAVWAGAVLMLSLTYGVVLTMLNSFFLAARCRRAGETDKEDGQRLLYTGAMLRFLGVLAGLLLAYALGLHLLGVAGGMLLAQLALLAYAASHSGYIDTSAGPKSIHEGE